MMRVKHDGYGGFIIFEGGNSTSTGPNPAGRDFRRAKRWIDAGNIPEPADPPPEPELTVAELLAMVHSGTPLPPEAHARLARLRESAQAKLKKV